MPPRSKALASAVESIPAPALRRSSRRSIPSPQSAAPSTSALSPSPTPTSLPSDPSNSRARKPRIKREPEENLLDAPSPAPNTSTKTITKSEPHVRPLKKEEDVEELIDAKLAATKKRRTKKEADEDETFPPRPAPFSTLSNASAFPAGDRRRSGLFIGAHISSAGGVENAPLNAVRIGGNAFSCFVRPKMQWASNPIPDTSAALFKDLVLQHSFMPRSATTIVKKEEEEDKKDLLEQFNGLAATKDYGYVVPHGCYLVNLANPDEEKREKSFEAFIDDLRRCEQLGIRLFNFHPGSMTAASSTGEEDLSKVGPLSEVRKAKAKACETVASYINRAHSLTTSVVILIENMAGSKNDTILGSSLHDLAAMMSHVKDKTRVGVCIDTCHAFAAGYDLTTPESYAFFAGLIDSTVGWENVRAFHLNDSKFALGCKRDRHENIGRGHIGLGGFWNIVNDPKWNGIPLVLETPALGNAMGAYPAKEGIQKMHQVWSYQIQALYALRGTKWGQWKEAEEWLAKVDLVVQEAEKLHATKKGSKSAGSAKKPKQVNTNKRKRKKAESEEEDDDKESELSSDE